MVQLRVLAPFAVLQNKTLTMQDCYFIKGSECAAIPRVLGMKAPMYNIQMLFNDLWTV